MKGPEEACGLSRTVRWEMPHIGQKGGLSCQRASAAPHSLSLLVCSSRHKRGPQRQLCWNGYSPWSCCLSLWSLHPQVNPSLHESSCFHSWIAAAWFGALKSRMPANSSKSLSWMAMPFPSPSRSQPSPSGQTVKIVSGSEPPSSTSSLFFKPKHQYRVHMRMSHGFFYSFYFQHSFYFQGVKGLFRVHKSLCIQWHFPLSSLPWDFFITCRWSRVENWLLNPADSHGWLKSGSPSSLPSSTLVKILHNHWKQFKRSCLWSIKQDSFSKGGKGLRKNTRNRNGRLLLILCQKWEG